MSKKEFHIPSSVEELLRFRSDGDISLDSMLSQQAHAGAVLVCPVCGGKVASYLPLPSFYRDNMLKYGFPWFLSSFETLNSEQYSCPRCMSSDRERLYALFIKKLISEIPIARRIKTLDFAPLTSFSAFMKNAGYFDYRTADLLSDSYDDKVDICNMENYADSSFDFFICSHVLEHVEDDLKALKELYRILKRGGRGILMSPVCLELTDTYENISAVTEADRWRNFGQNDHLRIYSKEGFIKRAEQAGFIVNKFGVEYFGFKTFENAGIDNKSMLYIVNK